MKLFVLILILPGLLFALTPSALAGEVDVYSTIPSTLPSNLPSMGYEASSLNEFGGLIQFSGSSSTYALTSATVVMSDWTYASEWTSSMDGTTITSTGFYVPLTLNLYNVGADNTVGSVLSSVTVDAFIPWRPEPTAGCGSNYLGSDGYCHGGALSTVSFDLAGLDLPGEIIYGVAFNTRHSGATPTGVAGPYDSLNFALTTAAPSAGSNPLPDTAYYAVNGTSTMSQDTGWSPYSGAVAFDETAPTPEPSSLLLLGTGLLGLAGILFHKFHS